MTVPKYRTDVAGCQCHSTTRKQPLSVLSHPLVSPAVANIYGTFFKRLALDVTMKLFVYRYFYAKSMACYLVNSIYPPK
jgi:hypothetical protein